MRTAEAIHEPPRAVRRARRIALAAGLLILAGSVGATILLSHGAIPRFHYWVGLALGSILLPAACLASYERRLRRRAAPGGGSYREWALFGSYVYWRESHQRLENAYEAFCDLMGVNRPHPRIAKRMTRWSLFWVMSSMGVAACVHSFAAVYFVPGAYMQHLLLGLYLPMALLMLPVGLVCRRRMVRLARRAADAGFRLCECCAYDLTGLPARHTCPECGCEFDVEALRPRWRGWASYFLWPSEVGQPTLPSHSHTRRTLVASFVAMISGFAVLALMSLWW